MTGMPQSCTLCSVLDFRLIALYGVQAVFSAAAKQITSLTLAKLSIVSNNIV